MNEQYVNLATPWYQQFDVAGRGPLLEMLHGCHVRVSGSPSIAGVTGVTVGIDSSGIFACIRVVLSDGTVAELYHDGEIQDEDGAHIGTHGFRSRAAQSQDA